MTDAASPPTELPELKVTRYEVEAGVAVVTLDRPDRLNAWTARMEHEYRACLVRADADPSVRAVVVTGAGRGFCAGADFDALDGLTKGKPYVAGGDTGDASSSARGDRARPDFDHAFSFPLGLRKPVIAAVNGPAAGVGFVVMCFADLRFAAAGAKLTTAFSRLGLPAEHGVSWVLPRLVGPARAADLLFSSRVVLAEEAAEMGLVNQVLPPGEVLDHSIAYARRLAAEVSPTSLAAIKAQLWGDQIGGLDASARRAVELLHGMLRAPDFAEGVAAFRAKRSPRFAPLPAPEG